MKQNCLFIALAASLLALSSPFAVTAPVQQAYLKASHPGYRDYFGYSVTASSDTVVVGAYAADISATNSGAAYVFVRSGTNWLPQAVLQGSNTRQGDGFGHSPAISGNTLAIGVPAEDGNALAAGAAYIFVRSGTNWVQQAYLKASNIGANNFFGYKVALSGDILAVGAYGEDSNATGVNGNQNNNSAAYSGAVYVFVRNGTNWTQQAYLKASNAEASDYFGESVSVSGETIVVTAPHEASNAAGLNGNQSDNSAAYSGAVYVFVRNGTNWTQQAYLKASNAEANDFFGESVSVSGDTIVVGALGESSSAIGVNGDQSSTGAPNAGAAYVFVRSGTNWIQQAYLKASNTGAGDLFGSSIAAAGDILVIAAYAESSSGTGVNGNQGDNSAAAAGAAYVFVRRGTNWGQEAYLKASNTEAFDIFGRSVAVSGDIVIVGGYHEDSNATNVNGNQNDNSVIDSGAAYIFAGFGIGPQLAITPDGSGGYLIRCNAIGGFIYQWQRAPTVDGPWTTNATSAALSSAPIEFHDTNAPLGQAFYRVAQQ